MLSDHIFCKASVCEVHTQFYVSSQYFEGFFPPGPTFFITEYSHPKLPEDMSLAILNQADLSLKNYRARTILYEAQTRSPDYARKILQLGVDIADRYGL